VDELCPAGAAVGVSEHEMDVFDVLWQHRLRQEQQSGRPDSDAEAVARTSFPPSLRRRYEVTLHPVTDTPVKDLRSVRARDIGQLIQIRAMVTRASDVKPLLQVAT